MGTAWVSGTIYETQLLYITPIVLLVQQSLQRGIAWPLQKCTYIKSLVPGSALHCPTDTNWYTGLYSLIHLHPQGISFLKARGNFYHSTTWLAGAIHAKDLDRDFRILCLHPPLGSRSYITWCPTWFELGVWSSPQLATGKVSLVFSMLSTTPEMSLGHNPIHGLFGWCSHDKIAFAECALSGCQWLQSSSADAERDIRGGPTGMAKSCLSNQRAFYKSLLSKWAT